MTVAAFMELALYHPEHGYYAAREQRSGRGGDFYTNVDVGPLFGELLAVLFARMASTIPGEFDLVEAAAGNGRLARDVMDGFEREAPDAYARTRMHLVERSAQARAAQRPILGPHAPKLASSSADLSVSFSGALYANELLDALPVHVIVMREEGPREIYVDVEHGALVERESDVSNPDVRQEFLAGPSLEVGTRAEVSLAAREWIRCASRCLNRGFLVLVDYGDAAAALRAPFRPEGTLRAFHGHQVSGKWIESPGARDLTAHVDFTALARWASEGGLELLHQSDQTRFLLGLGAVERVESASAGLSPAAALRRRLALKTLVVPGGMGSTHSVLVFGKRGQTPRLRWQV